MQIHLFTTNFQPIFSYVLHIFVNLEFYYCQTVKCTMFLLEHILLGINIVGTTI